MTEQQAGAAEELLTEIRKALNASGVWHLGMDTVDVIKSLIASRAHPPAAEPKGMREALEAIASKAELAASMCSSQGPADGFRILMGIALAALAADQKGEGRCAD